ncbi:hypothetical protein AJ80_03438 [Polytolypa hystricis UAMH7299]|uniref:Uncharacterized protein n=1 Tax=Polytolypa hystricis (strain UAMH7299) TaxID=1447883 RepID=A0A2B7YID5_POLH7|nr:hypothetical protein AJ80_03438 [Polytolypa hystricis UAMH7299]
MATDLTCSCKNSMYDYFKGTDTMDNLESRSLRQFDKLVQSGDIIFKDALPIHLPAQPFNLQFRIASSLTKKPQIDIKEAKEQEKPNGQPQAKPSPFARDPPEFVLDRVGPKHTLRFNKFCVVRPQFVLHTNEFEPQIDPLSAADLSAAWNVLSRLETPYIVIYNGGMQGGWSLPHRHVQLLPRPPKEEHDLYPDIYGIQDGIIPNIPFKHAARILPSSISDDELFSVYNELLAATGVDETIEYSHNLVLVRDWMLVIPRSCASQEGVKVVNAASMVGMIWIPSEDILNIWRQASNPMDILTSLGKPW